MMTKEANTNPPAIEDGEIVGGSAVSKAKEVKMFDEKEAASVDG